LALDGYTYNRNLAQERYQSDNSLISTFDQQRKAQLVPGIGYSAIYPNTWQPYGDRISGGGGDDVILGDDSSWTGQDLIDYKTNFGDTLDAINNWSNYYQTNDPWKTIEEKDSLKSSRTIDEDITKSLKIPVWSKSDPIDSTKRRLRLGDDEIFAGDGDDIVYGGFGSDLLVGGKGIDVIFAPAQILVDNFDPLWGEATVLYGDEFALKVDQNGFPLAEAGSVLNIAQINRRRYGINPSNNAREGWVNVLTPNPDVFIVDRPITTLSHLQGYQQDLGKISQELTGSSAYSQYNSLNLDGLGSKVVDTALDLVGFIPIVGNFIQAIGSILKTWFVSKDEAFQQNNKPDAADKIRVIRDFDLWDTLFISSTVGNSVTVDETTNASPTIDTGRWYSKQQESLPNGYNTHFDAVVKISTAHADVGTILEDFNFKDATGLHILNPWRMPKHMQKLIPLWLKLQKVVNTSRLKSPPLLMTRSLADQIIQARQSRFRL
jgi:Ca2+-binding RTX toxin-like protein